MSSITKYVVIFIVALALGYSLYPLLNSQSAESLQANSEQVELQTESTESSTHNALIAKADIVAKQQNSAANTSGDVVLTNAQEQQNDTTEKNAPIVEQQTKQHSAELNRDTELTTSQQELVEWHEQHKEQLNQTLEQQLPTTILDGMLQQIYTDNAFLDKVEEHQDPITDQDWAYITEQQIRDQIQQHQDAPNIELYSVICKQLTCELSGMSHKTGVWQQIYISLFVYFSKNANQFNSEAAKNVTFVENDIDYFYAQLVFSAP